MTTSPAAAATEDSKKSLAKAHLVCLYLLLCVYRLWNAWWIQTQFDPDEYWQTLEPAYCQAFGKKCGYTWEWTRRPNNYIWEGPVRSYLLAVPTYLLYAIVGRIQKWFHHPCTISLMVSKGPILLHAILVAAPTDLAVYIMSQNYFGVHNWWCLFCSITCWFHGYALIRTYSNSVETLLLALGMAMISTAARGANQRRLNMAFVLGGLSVAIRFTSLAAWVPIGIMLALREPSLKKRLKFLLYPCATYGLLGIGLSLLVDRYFYGFWTVPFLGNVHFNVVLGNGSLYGTHSWHWYLTAGIPAISGVMFPFLCLDLLMLLIKNKSNDSSFQSRQYLWIVIASYTALHSCSAHKEYRFLLPVLPLMCLLAGSRMGCIVAASKTKRQEQRRRRFLIAALVLLNYPHLIYLSMIHQRAPISVNQHILEMIHRRRQEQNFAKNNSKYSIHFLMGCHSTPLYSHLHIPAVEIDAWTLDCSPACRSDPRVECESDSFLRDPVAFVQENYNGLAECQDSSGSNNSQTCSSKMTAPDFLAVYAREAISIRPMLEENLGLREVSRFVNGIIGVKYKSLVLGDGLDGVGTYRFGALELFLDAILLFAKDNETVSANTE